MENTQNTYDASNDSIPMSTYEDIEPGYYHSRVTKIDAMPDMPNGACFKFHWVVVDGDHATETFDDLCSQKLSPKSKLFEWTTGLLGVKEFPEGFVLKMGNLIGKEANVLIVEKARPDGNGTRSKIKTVTPLTRKGAKPAPPFMPTEAASLSSASTMPLGAGAMSAPPSALFDDVPDPAQDEPMTARQKEQAAMRAAAMRATKAPQEEVPF